MQVIYLNATRRNGISYKKSAAGVPYDICNLSYLIPVEPTAKENMTFAGYGYEVREIELDVNSMAAFANAKPLTQIELILSPKPTRPSVNWVIGFK